MGLECIMGILKFSMMSTISPSLNIQFLIRQPNQKKIQYFHIIIYKNHKIIVDFQKPQLIGSFIIWFLQGLYEHIARIILDFYSIVNCIQS